MATRDMELEIWSSAIDQFPLCGTAGQKLRALIPFAIRAPSSHNSQPWLFRVHGDRLEVHLDPSRRLPVVDPFDREQVISCGAAIGYAEAALHNFGSEGVVELPAEKPDSGDSLVATIALGSPRQPTAADQALFEAIPKRHTNRLPFRHEIPDPEILQALADRGTQPGIWFAYLNTDSARLGLAELISEADRRQLADPDFRRELSNWVHPNWSERRDGLPGWSLGAGTLESAAIPIVLRTFDVGDGRAAIDSSLALGSPILAIIGSQSDNRNAWVQTGRVLSQVLLLAASVGLSASYLNQPIEVSALRERVNALLGRSGFAQLILRIGYPTGRPRPTPRRRVEEVLLGA